MNNSKVTILCAIVMFTIAGCVRRYTRFESQIKQIQCSEITGVTGIVNEDGASGKVGINVDIEWCDSYGRKNCCNKEINHAPSVVVKIGGQELSFSKKIEGMYIFNSNDTRVFKQNEEAEILVVYMVDSLGIELTRHSSYILYKDSGWGYSVH
ncbi:MAG TPA: hypothetical protein VIU12_24895 [Chryseolinea sp.]